MTPRERTLAALAALFAPARAAALAARIGSPAARDVAAHAARLAAAPRRERLSSLAAALATDQVAGARSRIDPASLERPAVACTMADIRSGGDAPRASAALVRLCREQMAA
jgi:hypothetical protein